MLLNRPVVSGGLPRIVATPRKTVRVISTFATGRGITATRMQPISRSVISRRTSWVPRPWPRLAAPFCAIGGQP